MTIDFQALAASLNPETLVPEWLPDGRRNGREWVARNPTRADKNPGSFSINLDNGSWSDFATGDAGGDLTSLWAYLHHGGDNAAAARDLAQRYGIADAVKPSKKELTRDRKPEAVYQYHDETGALRYEVQRFAMRDADGVKRGKTFRQRRPDPDRHGKWVYSIAGVERLPYRLPEMLARPGEVVFVCEGEKAADAVAGLGLVSTTNSEGAGKWSASLSRWFDGRRVVILPDNDEPGTDHARKVAAHLTAAGVEVRIAELPDLPPKGDAADWVAAGCTREDILRLAEAAPVWAPSGADSQGGPVPLHLDLNEGGFPYLGGTGVPYNAIENLEYLLCEYGIGVVYNVISKEIEIDIPGRDFSGDNEFGDAMSTITSLCARNRVPKTELHEYIRTISNGNRYNPAVEWIESKPWDGQDRFADLAETLDPADMDLAVILLRRWMIGAAAAAYCEDGFAMQGALVLQGGQGTGKTTWCSRLANDNLDLFQEGVMLNPADRDSVKSAISYWLVELGELDATFRKADIAALKSFLTKSRDEIRLPYARCASKLARRTAFLATVNDKRFLRDETGNRRYWTIETGPRINGRHSVDVQQVWAQAAQMWRDGEQHNLTREEMDRLNTANDAHTEISPVEELLLSKFGWLGSRRDNPLTATEALIAIGYDRPNRAQVREASAVLQKLTGGEARRTAGGKKRVFDLPPKLTGGEADAPGFNYEDERAF